MGRRKNIPDKFDTTGTEPIMRIKNNKKKPKKYNKKIIKIEIQHKFELDSICNSVSKIENTLNKIQTFEYKNHFLDFYNSLNIDNMINISPFLNSPYQ
jgi:hypothetical protein